MQALQGIKVLDLTRVLAGPSCTQTLADLGAEVIKVERPGVGDETRQWSPPEFTDGTPAYFATANRNKQSIAINLASAEGQAIIRRLAVEADVLVENHKTGGLAQYGLDYASLSRLNPRLIYASLTGFGQTGPDALKPGYDYIIQGLSGLMSITGPADGEPHKVGVAVVDLYAGRELTIGILAALLAREQTGLGQQVDVALFDSALSMLGNVGMNHLANHEVPPRLGNGHPSIVPYQVFATAGGQHFILACGNDKQFAAVCRVMGKDWHQQPEYATNPERVKNREALTKEMQAALLEKERDEWLALFEAAQVPCGAINNIAEALSSPQAAAREMVVLFAEQGRDVAALASPIKLSATPMRYKTPPPQLGEHTHQVLAKLAVDDDTIRQWQQKGIIG